MNSCLCCGEFIEKGAIYCENCGDWCFEKEDLENFPEGKKEKPDA